jgi:hypothetical protein
VTLTLTNRESYRLVAEEEFCKESSQSSRQATVTGSSRQENFKKCFAKFLRECGDSKKCMRGRQERNIGVQDCKLCKCDTAE